MSGKSVFKKQQKSLGKLMLQAGFINSEQLEAALEEQRISSEPLGKILVKKRFAREEDIINILKGLLVIIFRINNENFGVEIVFTREIIRYKAPAPIPALFPYMKGMLPVRDAVVPVMSLNERIFGVKDSITDETRILVLERRQESLGIVVDDVVSVKNFSSGSFEDINKYSLNVEKKFIAGLLKDKEEVVTLIKPEILFEKEKS